MSRPHVAVLFDHFGPYHWARLTAAGREMPITAVEVAGRSATYDWAEMKGAAPFRHLTLFPEGDSEETAPSTQSRAVYDALTEAQPDVVAVPGWGTPAALAALRWGAVHDVPAVMMSESTEHDFKRHWWREAIKRRLVGGCGAGLVGGTPHRAYLRCLGMPEENIHLGYDTVENRHFAEGARQARENGRCAHYACSAPYFLASGRFVPKKNFPALLDAFGQYRARVPESEAWDLVVLGEGPRRPAIERAAQEAGLVDAVHLPGFKQYEELPSYYGCAEAFIHPSTREQWGLVVNEAMAAGLPVLVSERCGCAPDLVKDGRNGFTFDPHDPSALVGLMARVAHGDVNRADMGAASQEIIERWGPERFATGLKKAAEAALQAGPPSSSLLDRLLINALMYR